MMLRIPLDISTGGRARTDTVLSHHRILSPVRCILSMA
jgi:hypothetical protein